MDIDTLEREAGAIHAEADAATKRLYTPDGKVMYAPDEHKKRLDTIEATREAKLGDMHERAHERAARELERVTKELAPLEMDPIYSLPVLEIERAKALSDFVQQEVAAAELPELAALVRNVAAIGNVTQAAVWRRCVLVRLEAERKASYQAGNLYNARELNALRAAVEVLEGVIWDKATREKKARLLEQRDAAEVYRQKAQALTRSRDDLRETGAKLGIDPEVFVKNWRGA